MHKIYSITFYTLNKSNECCHHVKHKQKTKIFGRKVRRKRRSLRWWLLPLRNQRKVHKEINENININKLDLVQKKSDESLQLIKPTFVLQKNASVPKTLNLC
jgi:hypothetical protein